MVTIFSAPNYCGSYDNQAAVFISEGEEVDIRTFTEKKDKPYLLPNPDDPKLDAITFFHGEMTGFVLDFLYQVFKTAHGTCRRDGRLTKTLASTVSYDADYLEKLLRTSEEKKE